MMLQRFKMQNAPLLGVELGSPTTNDHFDAMLWNATKYIVGRKMTLVFKFEL
jgi:glutathione peroxidase-family protein